MKRWIAGVIAVSASTAAHAEGTFTIGAGYNPDEDFVFGASVEQDNLFKTGHMLRMDAQISRMRMRNAFEYGIPNLAGTGLRLDMALFAEQKQLPGVRRDSAGGSAEISTMLGKYTKAFVRWRLERVTVKPGDDGILARSVGPGPVISPPTGDGMIAAVGAGITHDSTDSWIATRGTRAELYAETTDPDFGADYKLYRISARLERARTMGPITVRSSLRGSYVTSPGGSVPRSERLFHDGNRDIRGYAFGSGMPNGANLELTSRVEIEAPIYRKWGLGVAGFFDAGFAYNDDAAFGPVGGILRRSVGSGIVWRSPIGPLRFDWAIPLDGTDRKPQFMFWLGAGF